MKNIYRIIAALAACSISLSALATVTATVNSNVVASGESIQLRLQRDVNANDQPDLSPLKKDFDILGSSSGSNVQIINGHMSSQTQITVLLSPKHDGKLQIPPIQWGDEHSELIELTAGGSGSAAQQDAHSTNENAHVFLTTTLDQKQPYVQAAIVLTVRLYADQSLLQASLDLPASSDVLVKQLGKDTQLTETRNGRNYQVIERKYLLFPQRSGRLNINGPVLDAQIQETDSNDLFGNLLGQMPFSSMMNPTTHPIHLHAKAVELNVLPRPVSATGENWLPAQKVTLEESWRPNVTTIHAGEPLTRHLHLGALGLTGEQLPDLSAIMSVPDGIKAYPDQSSVTDNPQGVTVLGSRTQDIALMATQPGHYELPAVRLNWWDTINNTKQEVMLPALKLDVLAAIAGSSDVTIPPHGNSLPLIQTDLDAQASTVEPSAKVSNAQTWKWTSMVLGMLWLGTSLGWWRSRHHLQNAPPKIIVAEKQPKNITGASAFKAFQRACKNCDPHAARKQLLAWANAVWPTDMPIGLNELSRRLKDTKVVQAIRKLDRACYTGSEWHSEELVQYIRTINLQTASSENNHVLPELYP